MTRGRCRLAKPSPYETFIHFFPLVLTSAPIHIPSFQINMQCKFIGNRFWVRQLTFPNNNHFPSERFQLSPVSVVSFDVAGKFVSPELYTRLRSVGILTAFMAMPEATMHKNDCFVFWHNNIRFAGKIFTVEPESVTHSMQKRPDCQFRFCITGANPAHVPASVFGRQFIHFSRSGTLICCDLI